MRKATRVNKRPLFWGLAIAVVVVAAVYLASWAVVTRQFAATPSEADVVGVWQRDDSDMRMTIYPMDETTASDEDGPTGKITFANVPEDILKGVGDTHDNASKPITVTGAREPFTDGSWGGIATKSLYELRDGTVGTIYTSGNGLFGYELQLVGGEGAQYQYAFHRISSEP